VILLIKLSIIIPVFNAENTLKRCLDSVLQQKDDELEIVVINDGSKDLSDEIMQEYKLRYPEIISYYKKQNTGVADTRNYGIEKAKGKYIMFLDSDDYIDIHLYNIIKQYIERDIELIKFKLQRVDENNNIIEKVTGPIFEKTTGEEGFKYLYASDVLLDSPCVYVMKKDIFIRNKLLFNVGTEHEDFGLIPFVIVLARSMISIDFYGYQYVQSNGSITRNNDYNKTKKKAYDALKQYDEALIKIEKYNINKNTADYLKIYYTNAILLKTETLEDKDQKQYINEIKKRRMIKNIKSSNIKQLLRKIILLLSIKQYLKFRKKVK
jgi:glycosyltransferase involved in cell wall biosynthesis